MPGRERRLDIGGRLTETNKTNTPHAVAGTSVLMSLSVARDKPQIQASKGSRREHLPEEHFVSIYISGLFYLTRFQNGYARECTHR